MRIRIVLALVAGCGGSSSNNPDATAAADAPPDQPTDAADDTLACTPSGAPGAVTIDGQSGSASLTVTFVAHDPSGAETSRSAALGPDATTTLTVPSCGMVSAISNDDGRASALTWTNVQPGDHLVHFDRQIAVVDRPVAFTLPALTGATEYQIVTVCQANGLTISFDPQPGPITVTPHCPAAATTVSVVATATTATGTSASIASAPIVTTGTTNLTLPGYQPTQTSTAHLHHADAFLQGSAIYGTIAELAPDRLPFIGQPVNVPVTTADATVGPAPALAMPGFAEMLVSSDNSKQVRQEVELVRALANAATDLDVDLTANPAPPPTGGLAAGTLTWAVDRPLDADVLLVRVDLSGSTAVEWELLAPARPGTLKLPALPTDLVASTTQKLLSLAAIDATSITSYDQVRNGNIFQVIPGPGEEIRLSGTTYGSSFKRHLRRR